jgi:hypothetical protein
MKKSDSEKLDTIIAMLGDIVDVFGTRFDKIDERLDATATKADIVRVQEQVGSIEAELKHARYETHLGNLETKVFGALRG